ncbi:MAG TPA: DUF3857 domain-containing protein [Pyrinomonadaceae bacterium]|nr:DUF3857 domain-containing protein [Pyrinomonadaceae bacterium]
MLNLCKSPRGIVVSAVLFLFVFSASIYAQKAAEWRPISPADLQATKPVVEPDADAEALLWETRIDDSSDDKLTRKNYVRIKIFTERGREKFAKVDITFRKGRTKIKDIAARVVKPDGSTVDLAEKDIFEREIVRGNGVKVLAKSFAIPNIEPGVIVEYQYRESFEDSSMSGGRFYLQKDIPVRDLVYYYKPYNDKEPKTQLYNTTGAGFVKDEHGFYRLSRTNVPAYKEERYMPPEDMVKPYLALTGSSLDVSGTDMAFTVRVFDRSNPAQFWGSFASMKSGLVAAWLKDSDGVKQFTQSLISGAANDEDKLRRIYEFCRNLKNTTYDPSVTDDQLKSILKQKTKDIVKIGAGASATSGQINVLFGAMAAAAGFDTIGVYSSRRDEVFFEKKMTDASLLTFAGVGVDLGGDYKVLNPGYKYAPFGQLPWYRENSMALIFDTKRNGWLQLPLTSREQNLTKRTAKLTLAEDGTLEGTIAVELHGQEALAYRFTNYDDQRSKWEERLKDSVQKRITNAEISNISIENFDDISKPIVQRYTIKIPNYAQKTGKRMFFQPGIFEYGTSPAFASTTRTYGIAFTYPWSEKDEVEITYPSTYAIDNGEAPGDADAGDIGKDTIRIQSDAAASKIKYFRDFYFGTPDTLTFDVSKYSVLKELWDMIHKSDTAALSIKQK